ncbi:MAG: SpoIIE family protein phosphatase [Phaeodactylibacter sp.]|nr:SpoIIE family protein phosphatase [Phaeodactylibacter sp.]MCB9292089.1 SpoIIE family protein phosphatase [Lewinellaceae bacterium]
MTLDLLTQVLKNFQFFEDFTLEEIRHILSLSQIRNLVPGDVLIYPEVPNDTLFLVISGELRIILEKDGTKISIPVEVGECLGEMSIMMGRPTSALALAHHPSQILCIPEQTFWDHIAMTRQGVRNLMNMMALRLNRTNQSLIRKVEEQLKYQHLEKELEIAGKIQANIVPNGQRLFPRRPEVDAFALMNQAREVGGDFYDALVLDDEHIYFAIGDVSGKGMPAALFMMRAFTSLRLFISNNPGFENVVPSVNNWLAANNEDMMFVSLFAGVLNIRTGVFRYANGGHNPPFLALGGGGYQLMDLPKGTLVGIMAQSPFPVAELQLKPGDSLLLYTDGITEAMNAGRAMFETERIRETLNREAPHSMEALVLSLESAVETFVGNAPQHDDFTIFALRYLGPSGALNANKA